MVKQMLTRIARIGTNSGSIITGVIDKRKLHMPLMILSKANLCVRSTGNVKGKGEMEGWLVISAKNSLKMPHASV